MSAGQVHERLEYFIEYFVDNFELKLQAYHMIQEGVVKKAGKFSDSFSGKVGSGLGAGLGGGLGGLAGLLLGSPVSGAKVGANLVAKAGEEAGQFIGGRIGEKHNKSKIVNRLYLIERFRNDESNFRKALVEAGFDVFQSFEMQFMRVTTEQGPKKAMQLLARDATNRAIAYLKKQDAKISEGVILGKSKKEKVTSISPGFEIKYEYNSQKKTWSTSNLYSKAGILVKKDNKPFYYKKKSESDTERYGYRRLLTVEKWSELEKEYSLDNIAESKSGQFTDYNYILDQNDLEQKVKTIFEKINKNDKGLEETRIKEIMREVKDDILEEMQSLKKQSFSSEDRTILLSVESSLKSLNTDEYLEKFIQNFEEVKVGQQKIEKSIEIGLQRFDQLSITLDDHHNNTIQEIGNLHKAVKELPQQLSVNNKNESITFDVKDPVRSFIGRKQELKELHSKIQGGSERVTVISQMTSITGLGGIGKTELAREYIRIYSKGYDSNVIWINAESGVTLRESFCRLAQDKLSIRTKNVDDNEKDTISIVEEVYKYFAKRKVLFVFDNAENDDEFKHYLPLYALGASDNKPYILITSRENNEQWGIQEGITLDVFTEEEAVSFVKEALKDVIKSDDLKNEKIKKLALDKLHRFPLALQQAVAYIKLEIKKCKRRGKGQYTIDNYIEDYEKQTAALLNSSAFRGLDNDYAKTTLTTWKVTIAKIKEDEECGQLAMEILDVISYFVANNIVAEDFFLKWEHKKNLLWNAVELLHQYSMIKLQEGKIDVHRLVQEVIRLELREQNREEQTLRKALEIISEADSDHVASVWRFASEYAGLIRDFNQQLNHTFGLSSVTILHLLAENDNHETIENILKHVDRDVESIVNAVDFHKRTPLYIAAKNNNINVVKLFAKKGAKLGYTSTIAWDALGIIQGTGFTALHISAFNGHLDVVKFLISEDKTLLDIKDSLGQTPLTLAIHKGRLDVVQFIDPTDDASLLHSAVRNNNLKEVQTLVENNVDILNSMLGNWIPLHLAAFFGNLEVVEYLVDKNLEENINKIDGLDHPTDDVYTPLHVASFAGNLEIVKLLISKGANFRAVNKDDFTILHAASHNGHLSVVKYLIDEMGFDVNICDSNNDTPLNEAACNGKLDVVQFLLDREANINFKDCLGGTPLFWAAAMNYKKISKFLLEEGAKVIDLADDKTPIGRMKVSVLHIAAAHDDSEMIDFLIKAKGIDKDIGKDASLTPLHVAALFGSQAAIDKLIDKGACVDALIQFSNIISVVLSHIEDLDKIIPGLSEFIRRIESTFELTSADMILNELKITPNVLYKICGYPEKSSLKEKQNNLFDTHPWLLEAFKKNVSIHTLRKQFSSWMLCTKWRKVSFDINFIAEEFIAGHMPEDMTGVLEVFKRIITALFNLPRATEVELELD